MMLNPSSNDAEDLSLLNNKITFQAGKGNKLVSLLIRFYTVKSMEISTNSIVHNTAGISEKNDALDAFFSLSQSFLQIAPVAGIL